MGQNHVTPAKFTLDQPVPSRSASQPGGPEQIRPGSAEPGLAQQNQPAHPKTCEKTRVVIFTTKFWCGWLHGSSLLVVKVHLLVMGSGQNTSFLFVFTPSAALYSKDGT